mgnify:CR=1 FL=1
MPVPVVERSDISPGDIVSMSNCGAKANRWAKRSCRVKHVLPIGDIIGYCFLRKETRRYKISESTRARKVRVQKAY